jgi:protein TonB
LSLQPDLLRVERAPARAAASPAAVQTLAPMFTPLRYEPEAGRGTRLAGTVVLALHLLGIWALMHLTPVREAVHKLAPLVVSIFSTPQRTEPPKPLPLPPPPQAHLQPTEPATLIPVFQVNAAAAPNAAAPLAALSTPATTLQPSEPVTAVAVQPPQPPAPKQIAASAVRYLVAPPVEVPMLSRRAGESGVVLLRVLVDTQGLPKQILLHKSSGFARLDEQALTAMRQARFKPQTENGQAIEWFVIAPLSYELER